MKVYGPRVNGPFSFNNLVTEEITTTDAPMTTTTVAEETTSTTKAYGNFIDSNFVNDGYGPHADRVIGGYGDRYGSGYGTGYDNYHGHRVYSGSRQFYSTGHSGGTIDGGGSRDSYLKKRFGY